MGGQDHQDHLIHHYSSTFQWWVLNHTYSSLMLLSMLLLQHLLSGWILWHATSGVAICIVYHHDIRRKSVVGVYTVNHANDNLVAFSSKVPIDHYLNKGPLPVFKVIVRREVLIGLKVREMDIWDAHSRPTKLYRGPFTPAASDLSAEQPPLTVNR